MAGHSNHKERLRIRDRRIWLTVLGIGAGLLVLASHFLEWEWDKILWAIAVFALLGGAPAILASVVPWDDDDHGGSA